MRYEIDNTELQDKEVSGWWNDERTKKWHKYTYDKNNPLSHHLILRQKKVLSFLQQLNLPKGAKVLELGGGAGQTAGAAATRARSETRAAAATNRSQPRRARHRSARRGRRKGSRGAARPARPRSLGRWRARAHSTRRRLGAA